MRDYVEHNEGFVELSCGKEAANLGGKGKAKGRDHNQHIKELQKIYGRDDADTDLGEWDLKMRGRLKK